MRSARRRLWIVHLKLTPLGVVGFGLFKGVKRSLVAGVLAGDPKSVSARRDSGSGFLVDRVHAIARDDRAEALEALYRSHLDAARPLESSRERAASSGETVWLLFSSGEFLGKEPRRAVIGQFGLSPPCDCFLSTQY